MKINLHCHSNYSDAYCSLEEMAIEHQKQNFSAFVVTDHCYPFLINDNNETGRYLSSFAQFQAQTQELESISKKLNFPCMQGIELALFGEEVLVFGNETIQKIFEYATDINKKEYAKYGHSRCYHKKLSHKIINILQQNKSKSAIILCHPRLFDGNMYENQKLFSIIDGYEFQNSNIYYFSDSSNLNQTNKWNREVPIELKKKKKFYNSDAHSLIQVNKTDGNLHHFPIRNLEELINFIKTPTKSNQHINNQIFQSSK